MQKKRRNNQGSFTGCLGLSIVVTPLSILIGLFCLHIHLIQIHISVHHEFNQMHKGRTAPGLTEVVEP